MCVVIRQCKTSIQVEYKMQPFPIWLIYPHDAKWKWVYFTGFHLFLSRFSAFSNYVFAFLGFWRVFDPQFVGGFLNLAGSEFSGFPDKYLLMRSKMIWVMLWLCRVVRHENRVWYYRHYCDYVINPIYTGLFACDALVSGLTHLWQ